MATFYTKWSFTGTDSPNGANYTVDGNKVTYYNDVRYKFIVKEVVNNADNTSTFVVDKYAVFYYTWDNNLVSLSITMKSKIPSSANYKSETKSVSPSTSKTGYVYVGQDSFTVPHNPDGSGSTSFTGLGMYTGGSGNVYTRTVSATLSMTKINRVSTITSNATNNTKFGDEITFAISRYDSKFTHNLSYKMYDATATIATGVGTSLNWTIPTSLVASSPENAQPSITITCVTKNGSTTIGSTTYSFKCLVPSEYAPICQLSLIDEGIVPSAWGVWVKSKSKIKGIITTGTSIAGDTATIKSYLAKANDNTFMTNPFLTDFLKNSGEITATVTVTDTRDRTASAEETIEVIDYFPPTISMCKVERCDSNGTLNEEGTYGKATVEFQIAPVSNKNAKTVKVSCGSIEKEVTLSEYEGIYVFTELFENLENNASYNFEFELIDSFDSIPQTYTLSPSFVTQSLLAGGRGVTFGQTAVKEGLQVHMNAEFYKDTFAKNINISGLKIEKSNDEWRFYIDE